LTPEQLEKVRLNREIAMKRKAQSAPVQKESAGNPDKNFTYL
jgi:hypothetical protein